MAAKKKTSMSADAASGKAAARKKIVARDIASSRRGGAGGPNSPTKTGYEYTTASAGKSGRTRSQSSNPNFGYRSPDPRYTSGTMYFTSDAVVSPRKTTSKKNNNKKK